MREVTGASVSAMADLVIVEHQAGRLDHLRTAGHRRRDRIAGTDAPGALLHGAVEDNGGLALLGREVDVARGHRESVALAHGAGADHLDTEVEVARHLRHHAQLLEILFAEDRDIRPALREQLADDSGDTAEEVRAEAVLEAGERRPLRRDAGGKPLRIHGRDARVPDDIDVLGRELGDVGLPGARIGAEILGRSELGRVDEDRHHDAAGAPLGEANQRHMPVMEGPHGRDQCDRGLSLAEIVDGASQGGDRAGDQWAC
ncbi:hypothetical protein ABIA03_007451 [Bradyrhizobium yuanmingense]